MLPPKQSELGPLCYPLTNDMISLTERSEVREIGTGTLNEHEV